MSYYRLRPLRERAKMKVDLAYANVVGSQGDMFTVEALRNAAYIPCTLKVSIKMEKHFDDGYFAEGSELITSIPSGREGCVSDLCELFGLKYQSDEPIDGRQLFYFWDENLEEPPRAMFKKDAKGNDGNEKKEN